MPKHTEMEWAEDVFLFGMEDGSLWCPKDVAVDWVASEIDPTFDEVHPGYILYDEDGEEYVVVKVEGLEEVEWEEPL